MPQALLVCAGRYLLGKLEKRISGKVSVYGIDLSNGDTNMRKPLMLIALGLAAFVMGGGLLAAQDPVVGSNDPESLFTSKDSKLNTNKQAAMHIMRDLLEAGHWDEAPKWLTEKYIQHNPCCANGRQTVMKFFGGRGTPRPIPT